MKNCEYWQQQLSRFLDGDLTSEEEDALWAHIADCPDCAQAFEDFSQQTSVLRAQVVRPPVDLSRLVMARIKNGQTDPASPRAEKPVSHRLRPWRKLAVAACFVALVAAAAVTGLFSRGVPMSGNGESAAYLPSAQSDTVYAAVSGRSADTAEAASAQEDTASDMLEAAAPAEEAALSLPAPEPDAPEAAEDTAADEAAPENDAVTESATMPIAADEAIPAAGETGLTGSADSGIMTVMEPPASTQEDGAPACQVLDGAGQPLGRIEDAAALRALLTGEGWDGGEPEPACTLELDGDDYAFAETEDGGLLWRCGGDGWTLSPAAMADLQALILPA